MNDFNRKEILPLLIIFAIAFTLCSLNIWGYPIAILDEAKNAEAAREMLVNKEHFLPKFNLGLRSDKPPLHYFFMQIAYSLFGANVFSARLFSALVGTFLFCLLFLFVKYWKSIKLAWLSTLILLSSFFWIQEFHLAVPDPYLLFFMCVGWMAFYSFYRNSKIIYLWLFYVCIGLATLSKGPIAIALSGLIVLVFLLHQRQLSLTSIKQFKPLVGALIVLAIAMPWFVWIHLKTDGAFTNGFFIEHNLQRFGKEMEGHGGTFLLTWVFVVLGLFPFGAFIPQAITHAWRNKKGDSFLSFCLVITIIVIGFFSFSSTRLPNYTLPAIPFLAILMARYLEAFSPKHLSNIISLILIGLVSFAVPFASFFLLKNHSNQIIPWLSLGIFGLWVIYHLWVGYKSFKKNKNSAIIRHIVVGWIGMSIIIFGWFYTHLAALNPVQMAIEQLDLKSKDVSVYKAYDPAFNFNLQRTFTLYSTIEEGKIIQKQNPDLLFITKDKALSNSDYDEISIIFNEPSNFENYNTVIFQFKMD